MERIILKFSAILFTVCFTMFVFTYGTAKAESPQPSIEEVKTTWSKEEVKLLVNKYADMYKVSRVTMNKVVSCESGYNYKAVNMKDSHKLSQGSHGVSQFSKETFIGFSKQMGKDYTDPYNADNALQVMSWAISKGYGNHWTCYKKLT